MRRAWGPEVSAVPKAGNWYSHKSPTARGPGLRLACRAHGRWGVNKRQLSLDYTSPRKLCRKSDVSDSHGLSDYERIGHSLQDEPRRHQGTHFLCLIVFPVWKISLATRCQKPQSGSDRQFADADLLGPIFPGHARQPQKRYLS